MKIRKKNGNEEDFTVTKIIDAIKKANDTVSGSCRLSDEKIKDIATSIETQLSIFPTTTVDIVHDKVEEALTQANFEIAKKYIIYRYEKKSQKKLNDTEEKIVSICDVKNEDVSGDNANKNPVILPTQRDYIAGEECKSIALKTLPKDIVEAHLKGYIHYHDMDYSPTMHESNCCLVNLKDMFEHGFMLNQTAIVSPKSFRTACNLASQIQMAVASQQYGGQTISLAHLAKYIDVSRKKIYKETMDALILLGITEVNEEAVKDLVEQKLRKEIKDGLQTYQYQLLTLITCNGQTPFTSLALDFNDCETEQEEKDLAMAIEEVFTQRMEGIPNEKGENRPVLFPKLLYVLDEGFNIDNNDKYYYLTSIAAKCSTLTMQPDFISAKKSRELKDGQVIKCMGCRSFLTPYYKDSFIDKNTIVRRDDTKEWVPLYTLDKNDRFDNGFKLIKKQDSVWQVSEPITWGRFNQGVITANLPYAAMLSKRNGTEFFDELDKQLELCHKALLTRHASLVGVKAKVAPILWQWGGLTRLGSEDTIDKYLLGDYSTISLGYVGLYEVCEALLGKSNTSVEGSELAYKVLQYMNAKCEQWKKEENIPYSIYGTPEEATTEKFAMALKREFGKVEGVTDHDYVTNSYHVNPAESINAFDKVSFEGRFLALSKGGAVSYVEASPSIKKNIPAVEILIRHIYESILYCELNTKIDYCFECGSKEELALIQVAGKYLFKCRICGNMDQTKLSGYRRMCGYIGEATHGISPNSPNANQGRLADIYARKVNLGE